MKTERADLTDEDYETLWKDKTRLIWIMNKSSVGQIDPEILIQLNNRLIELGADYVVQFKIIDPPDISSYYQHLIEMKERTEQVDLFNSGYGSDSLNQTYLFAIKHELFEPLDDYLNSEIGQTLYSSMDPLTWASVTVNGKIYGIAQRRVYATHVLINKQVAAQYNVELPEHISNLADLSELFAQFSTHENKPTALLYYGYDGLHRITNFSYLPSGIAVGYNESGNRYTINPFEHPDIVSLLHTLYEYQKQGYFKMYPYVPSSNDVFAIIAFTYPEIYSGNHYWWYNQPLDVISYPFLDNFYEPAINAVNGVASWSKHKDRAMDLLTKLYTDKELANLLMHGIEGKHYKLENGKAVMLNNLFSALGTEAPVNHWITYPRGLEPLNKEEVYRKLNVEKQASPIMDFQMDSSNITMELEAVMEIYKNYYDKIWNLQVTHPDGLIGELREANEQLKQAGIARVLEEINAQLAVN